MDVYLIKSVASNNNSSQPNHSVINSAPIKILALAVGALALALIISYRNATAWYLEDSDLPQEAKNKIIAAIQKGDIIKRSVKKLNELKSVTHYSDDEIEECKKNLEQYNTEFQSLQSEKITKEQELSEANRNNAHSLANPNAILPMSYQESVIFNTLKELGHNLRGVVLKRQEIEIHLENLKKYNTIANEIRSVFELSDEEMNNPGLLTPAIEIQKIKIPVPANKQQNILNVIRWVENSAI